MENDTKDNTSSKGKVIEIESKKLKKLKKIHLIIDTKDLPEGTKKEDVIAALRVNGEKEEEKNEEKRKFKAIKFIPIPIILAIAIMAKSCSRSTIDPNIITEEINKQVILYNLENYAETSGALVNYAGQEKMTAEQLDQFMGNWYDSAEQYLSENMAVEDINKFNEISDSIDENIQKLFDNNLTQESKMEVIQKIIDLQAEAKGIYTQNEDLVKKCAQEFINASSAYKDDNTENEILNVEALVKSYMKEIGIIDTNLEQLEEISELDKQGFELEFKNDFVTERGDYIITVDGVREIIEEQSLSNSRNSWSKFMDSFRNRNQQENNKINDGIEK